MKLRILPNEFHAEVLRLYLEEGFSTRKITAWLLTKQVDIYRVHVAEFLKTKGVLRSKIRVAVKRNCQCCDALYQATGSHQKLCTTCCPTPRSRTLFFKFGFTHKEFELMLQKQQNCCAICDDQFENEGVKKLQVDHCHKTNKVRGLLCQRCNMVLGFLELIDHPSLGARLERIKFYLSGGSEIALLHKQIFPPKYFKTL